MLNGSTQRTKQRQHSKQHTMTATKQNKTTMINVLQCTTKQQRNTTTIPEKQVQRRKDATARDKPMQLSTTNTAATVTTTNRQQQTKAINAMAATDQPPTDNDRPTQLMQ